MGIDMLSLSAHKFHGPKGIGALYVKENIRFQKFMNGGHQEINKRAGTENTAGISKSLVGSSSTKKFGLRINTVQR